MCGIVYANCRAALRQQSPRRSPDASSAACDECYLVAPRSHSSSVSTFVSPAHSSQADPIRCANTTSSKRAMQVRPLGRILHSGPETLQPREPSSQITVRAFILRSNARIPYSPCSACTMLPRARPPVPDDQTSAPKIEFERSPCQLQLSEIAEFKSMPPITGPGECAATDVVNVNLPDNHRVVFSPVVTLQCSMAEVVAHWVRDDVAPTRK